MKIKGKIDILLLTAFACVLAIDMFYFGFRSFELKFETIAIKLVIIILFTYLTSRIVFKIIFKEYCLKKNIIENYNIDSLADNIPGGMINMTYENNKWNINYVSLWCYKLLGYEKHVDENRICDIIYEKDRLLIINILKDILLGSEYVETEIRVKNSESQLIWIKVKINGVYKTNGELDKVVVIIIDIDDVKKENERLLLKARKDSLTQVLNKEAIIEEIENYIFKNESVGAFWIIDIDNFKLFNDLLGHIYGDEALVVMADNLKKICGENCYIGRLGGDEFCVFMKGVSSEEYVIEKVEMFLKSIREIRVGNENKLRLLVSIGVAMYPEHGLSFRELYINSDKALYNTKNNGKNGYSIFK